MEEWRDIEGYEGKYQVSNLGRIKSLNYNNTGNEKLLTLCKDKDGYLQLSLSKNGNAKTFKVHRLVAETFIPNPDGLPEVNHKIDDFEHRSDNRVGNLEWCTREYNNNYGTIREKQRKNHADVSGSKNPRAKKVRCITTGKTFNCIKEAAEFYGIERRSISSCCKGRLKTAGKMRWEYMEE